MAFDNFLKQTATIKLLVSAKDANQGTIQVWNTIGTAKCMVQPWSGGIGREEEKDMSLATHKILFSGTHDLNAKHQVHVGSIVYNVLKCRNWNSIGHHTTIECVVETS